MNKLSFQNIQSKFGSELQENIPLAKYTSARIGGSADFLLIANTSDDLASFANTCWSNGYPFKILGGGSNILISDYGVREIVIINKAKNISFLEVENQISVTADSGVNIGNLAKKCAQKGLSGLEWAAGIPGTVGGAVFGNAGAHGSDISENLITAKIISENQIPVKGLKKDLDFSYRSSKLKKSTENFLILNAEFLLSKEAPEAIEQRIEEYRQYRRTTQPPGASMGSMFKNPESDYAGRLIEAAGIKGKTIGGAKISEIHGNFIINNGDATANDVHALLMFAQSLVFEKFKIKLHLEIELLGEWDNTNPPFLKQDNGND